MSICSAAVLQSCNIMLLHTAAAPATASRHQLQDMQLLQPTSKTADTVLEVNLQHDAIWHDLADGCREC
jgi:hypothetical protein